jgi:hypothetical protein
MAASSSSSSSSSSSTSTVVINDDEDLELVEINDQEMSRKRSRFLIDMGVFIELQSCLEQFKVQYKLANDEDYTQSCEKIKDDVLLKRQKMEQSFLRKISHPTACEAATLHFKQVNLKRKHDHDREILKTTPYGIGLQKYSDLEKFAEDTAKTTPANFKQHYRTYLVSRAEMVSIFDSASDSEIDLMQRIIADTKTLNDLSAEINQLSRNQVSAESIRQAKAHEQKVIDPACVKMMDERHTVLAKQHPHVASAKRELLAIREKWTRWNRCPSCGKKYELSIDLTVEQLHCQLVFSTDIPEITKIVYTCVQKASPEFKKMFCRHYSSEEDVSAFIDECCIRLENNRVPTTIVVNAYHDWCETKHKIPLSDVTFFEIFNKKGVEKKILIRDALCYHGFMIRLAPEKSPIVQ